MIPAILTNQESPGGGNNYENEMVYAVANRDRLSVTLGSADCERDSQYVDERSTDPHSRVVPGNSRARR